MTFRHWRRNFMTFRSAGQAKLRAGRRMFATA
jgi:hypothetical protein